MRDDLMKINIIRFYLAVSIGILTKYFLKALGFSATSLPGKIAYAIYPEILRELNKRCKSKILITGTNGKSTTTHLINLICEKKGVTLCNESGANMISGIVSTFISKLRNYYDYCIFEVDEGSIKKISNELKPDFVVVTNIFRDQLDRYGEVDLIRNTIFESIANSFALLNGDDPNLNLYNDNKKAFFGLEYQNSIENRNLTLDTQFCPLCGTKLSYEYYTVGHLGKFFCPNCGFRNAEPQFLIRNIKHIGNSYTFVFVDKNSNTLTNFKIKDFGAYQLYNVCAAISTTSVLGINQAEIHEILENFSPKLGRFEEIKLSDKTIIINLVKNPVSLSETLYTISNDNSNKVIVLILNDNYADGRDVSWIWDADFDIISSLKNLTKVYCGGKRKEEILLRLKYTSFRLENCYLIDLRRDIKNILAHNVEKIYFLPTYTALFETRKIILETIQRRK
ncbi:MAG: MurT ligase domain-containing protein [Caldisericum sp.]|uniref:Mur ligase family protein n=1 Tax=Caldisericum sp. TaxID=2499687 RepID=UPI003D0F8F07